MAELDGWILFQSARKKKRSQDRNGISVLCSYGDGIYGKQQTSSQFLIKGLDHQPLPLSSCLSSLPSCTPSLGSPPSKPWASTAGGVIVARTSTKIKPRNSRVTSTRSRTIRFIRMGTESVCKIHWRCLDVQVVIAFSVTACTLIPHPHTPFPICAYLQNTQGANGKRLKELSQYIIDHGCQTCGSVCLSICASAFGFLMWVGLLIGALWFSRRQ